MRNLVAKHARKFNKAHVFKDRKRIAKNTRGLEEIKNATYRDRN